MDIMQLGTQLLMNKLGGNSDSDGVESALSGLLGSNSSGGGLDLASLVSKMTSEQGGGLQELATSWLGDGDNAAISGEQIKNLFGEDKISQFASQLGIDKDSAAESLSDAVPQMVDKSSSAGSLLDAIGGIDGALNLAKKLF
jgi:uncharacterized protein YidB (DUF937 family)